MIRVGTIALLCALSGLSALASSGLELSGTVPQTMGVTLERATENLVLRNSGNEPTLFQVGFGHGKVPLISAPIGTGQKIALKSQWIAQGQGPLEIRVIAP